MENPFDILNQNIEKVLQELKEIRVFLEEQQNTNIKEQVTVEEAAEQLRCSKLTIYNWIKKGTIKATKLGRRILIKQSELDDVLIEIKSLKYKR